MRHDMDVQEYRDFAENRGKYVPGAINVPVYRSDGSFDGYVGNAPMPDFSMVSDHAYTTFITPSLLVGVRHVSSWPEVKIGNKARFAPSYITITRNNHPDGPGLVDFYVPRVSKVLVESAPAPWVNYETFLLNRDRYTAYARIGAGYQMQEAPPSHNPQQLASYYQYKTGGIFKPEAVRIDDVLYLNSYFPDDPRSAPLAITGTSGDSGSPVFAWDRVDRRWVLVALNRGRTFSALYHRITFTQPLMQPWLDQVMARFIDADVEDVKTGGPLVWRQDVIAQQDQQWQWHGMDAGSAPTAPGKLSYAKLIATKDLRFNGEGGTIELMQSVNMGAGSLRFSADYTLRPAGDKAYSWVGGGVDVDKDKTVLWQVNGLKDDALHKIGAGTLHVNAKGRNPGELNLGDGVVILDQQADAQGNKQAFSQATLLSGRGTLVLNSADQIASHNIRFGYRGGTLDVNGNDVAFDDILHNDNGARIVNHHTDQRARLTLTGDQRLFLGHLGDDASRDKLDVTTHQRWQLNGGAHLNHLQVADGALSLGGQQVEHAGNLFFSDDWLAQTFNIRQTDVAHDATLNVTEHASVTSTITLNENSTLNLQARAQLAGNVVLNAASATLRADIAPLISTQGDLTSTLSADISGEGRIVKSGEGRLMLSGNVSNKQGVAVQ